MKRVYIVTSGSYSDYHIGKVFSDREKANMYSLLDPDRRVEEYYMDDVELNTSKRYLLISYDYRHNYGHEFTLRNTPLKPRISKEWGNHFEFTVPMDNERVYKNLARYGKNSKVILKIAQDKFAEYLYEHNTSKEELIDKLDKRYDRGKYSDSYLLFASTSCDIPTPTSWIAKLEENKRVPEIMKQKAANGEPLPTLGELNGIYDDALEEVEKEHEHD